MAKPAQGGAGVSRSRRLALLLLAAAAWPPSTGCGADPPDTAPPAAPPNVVLVVLDDAGIGDLGAYGGTQIATPRIDRLADEGVRLSRYYVNAPVCSPTRAALLTGRFPAALGIWDVFGSNRVPRGLPAGVPTLPGVLRDRGGYRTAHVGKWHLGSSQHGFGPEAYGFDHVVRRHGPRGGAGATGLDWRVFDRRASPRERVCTPDDDCGFAGHRTAAYAEYAIRFIDSVCDASGRCERPFFLNVWLNAPHVPSQPPEPGALPPAYRDAYPAYGDAGAGPYRRDVSHADFQIGRIVDALAARGLADRTLVIVTSDNGAEVATGHPESNGPWRGGKGDVFEGGIRQPLVLWWPGAGGLPAGTARDGLVTGLDLFPTLLALAGIDGRDLELDGRDVSDLLRSGASPPEPGPLFWANKACTHARCSHPEEDRIAVREGDWKLVHQSTLLGPAGWQLDVCGGRGCLFDLASDPRELRDLADNEPERLAGLWSLYRDWRERVGRVAWRVDETVGDVTIEADGARWRFGAHEEAGGAIRLAPAVTVHDLDFSVRLTVVPDALGARQVIAEQPGGWRLELDAAGRVHLEAEGEAGGSDPTPRRVDLASRRSLAAGAPAEIVATVYGNRGQGSTLALYLDGAPQAFLRGAASLGVLGATDDPRIRVGRAADGAAPFRGEVADLSLYTLALTPEEVARR